MPIVLGNCLQKDALLAVNQSQVRYEKPKKKWTKTCLLFVAGCKQKAKKLNNNLPFSGAGGTRFISFEGRHWHSQCFVCASCKDSMAGKGFITVS